MPQSKKTVKRLLRKQNHRNNTRLSSSLTYIKELLRRKQINPNKFSPIFKDYKNMIINKDTNQESNVNTIIYPGGEFLLPIKIHPKEVRLVVFDGYNSNFDQDEIEFEEWFNNFNSDKVWKWINIIIENINPIFEYNSRDKGDPSCGCMRCRQADPSKMSHNKHAKNQNIKIRIENEIGEIDDEKFIGKKESGRYCVW
jgi:hypothetical protein